MPKEIDKLELLGYESPNLLKVERVNQIGFNASYKNPKEYKELIKILKKVKVVKISGELTEYLSLLPSTVREINICGLFQELDNFEEIIEKLPYLIAFKISFPIEALDRTKLRAIYPKMSCTEEKFSLRPRKITVDSVNAVELNKHAELFEKVESVVVDSDQFDFDVLSSEIKRIRLNNAVNEESNTLNRPEKERK